MVVIDCFQERLLHRIDKQIADAEQLLHASIAQTSCAAPEAILDAVDNLHEFLIRTREHRRRVRRSFHLRQQSFTDALVPAASAERERE
jgi:hypothetical protein